MVERIVVWFIKFFINCKKKPLGYPYKRRIILNKEAVKLFRKE